MQLTLADVIPWQDIETFCFEIASDAEDLQESGLVQFRIDKPFFSLHFSADLLLDDYSFESTREASISSTNWTHLLRQWRIDPPDRSLRLFRVHGGDLARAAGEHHLLITTWQTDQTPGLICDLRHQKPLFAVKDLAGPWKKDLSCEKPWESHTKLWCRGRPLNDSLPFQCGTAIYATLDLMPTRKARVDENDLAPPPNFDMDIDEMMVLPEDVQGRDDPIVIIRDDEDLILQALTAYEEVGVVNIAMFGFDGESIGRRDREVSPATFEAIQRAIEISWSDYQGHLIKPVLVRPQPPALRGQGLIFVVAIQHIFAGTPTPQPGCSLCLAGIQLSYAGSNEPDVHRAFEIEEDFAVVDIRQRLQLSSLCQPQGRRQCDFALELRALAEDTRYRNRPGSYITADIQLERALFDIARAFRDLDSVIADIDTALQAENIEQIRIVQHGFRFRPLGVVTQIWNNRDPVDSITLSQQFARGWTRHPLDRLKIFRVRALDCVEPAVATLSLHFIMAFDLVPGNAVCLVMKGNEQPWPIAGPHLLQPQFWAADGLDPASANPLTDDNYEIMLYMGRTPTLTATSGDTIVYVDPAGEPDDPPPAESDEADLLQLHLQDARQDCNFAATNPELKSNPTFEIPGPASEHGRTLELFPLLWGDCCEVPLPCAKVECQQFLRACQQFPLCQTLPDDFTHHLKPITLAYLDTCTDEIFDRGDLHIYTDGSSYIHREDEYVEREASWAAAVFRVDGTRRCFLGWTAGFVADLPEQRTYIGANARGAMQAERTGIFWIAAWTLGLPAGQNIHLFVDNQPACFGATGQWTFDLADDLACRDRYVFLLASEKHSIRAHHVKSHSAQPMNELVDGIASALPNARHCLAFKNAQIEKTIANFEDFNVLWFHMISSTILQPVHNDRLVLLPVDEDRLFCPKLSRQRDSNWKEADEQQRAHMSISIVTYNVLSLRHCDPSKEVDADSIFPGKTKYIAKQMLEARHHVLTLQECRSSHSGIFENGELIRIVSAGLPEGIYGTEIWLNKSCPLGKIGKNKLGFDRQHLLILHADPRLLVAKIKVADQTVVIISGHCPHSLDTQEVRERWWTQLDDILRRLHTNDLIICGCDFNARMPNARLPYVGDLLCEKGNANTAFLESTLGKFNLFLPSTFSELHNGPSETWRHSSGQTARLDYIAVCQASWDALLGQKLMLGMPYQTTMQSPYMPPKVGVLAWGINPDDQLIGSRSERLKIEILCAILLPPSRLRHGPLCPQSSWRTWMTRSSMSSRRTSLNKAQDPRSPTSHSPHGTCDKRGAAFFVYYVWFDLKKFGMICTGHGHGWRCKTHPLADYPRQSSLLWPRSMLWPHCGVLPRNSSRTSDQTRLLLWHGLQRMRVKRTALLSSKPWHPYELEVNSRSAPLSRCPCGNYQAEKMPALMRKGWMYGDNSAVILRQDILWHPKSFCTMRLIDQHNAEGTCLTSPSPRSLLFSSLKTDYEGSRETKLPETMDWSQNSSPLRLLNWQDIFSPFPWRWWSPCTSLYRAREELWRLRSRARVPPTRSATIDRCYYPITLGRHCAVTGDREQCHYMSEHHHVSTLLASLEGMSRMHLWCCKICCWEQTRDPSQPARSFLMSPRLTTVSSES